jgi:hypothetical protein
MTITVSQHLTSQNLFFWSGSTGELARNKMSGRVVELSFNKSLPTHTPMMKPHLQAAGADPGAGWCECAEECRVLCGLGLMSVVLGLDNKLRETERGGQRESVRARARLRE